MKPKYKLNQEVIILTEDPIRVRRFVIGGIMITEDGIEYHDGINIYPQHRHHERNVFKTEADAMKRANELIESKVSDYRTNLIHDIGKED